MEKTNRAVKLIAEEEKTQRQEKMARLRKARHESEKSAATPADETQKKT